MPQPRHRLGPGVPLRTLKRGRRRSDGPALWLALAATASALAAAFVAYGGAPDDGQGGAGVFAAREKRAPKPTGDRRFATNDPIRRACALGPKILSRIRRGLYGRRAGDLLLVPQRPNYAGGFVIPGHSGPWDYLQEVPLVLYGPERIEARGDVARPVDITHVFPTVGRLTHVDLPPRDGVVLEEALRRDAPGVPRLVVTIVWDGVGDNVLERWPRRWPRLKDMMRRGTSYANATVGSSPSITPATHANLGTGSFPRRHGITAIALRADDGHMTTALLGRDPRDLELTTFADEIDLALRNRPEVGMLAWQSWHMTMLGHGRQTPGGDADQLGLIGFGRGSLTGSPEWYSTPSLPRGVGGPQRHAEEVDREDGKADGKWMGHELLDMHADPAWIRYQGDAVIAMLRRGRYGRDEVPDLFFTNFKVTDIVGHQYTMESKEMGEVLAEQDAQLQRILDYLDRVVGDYVVILTADHGHTPPWSATGGWPVVIREVGEDVDRRFGVPDGESLIAGTSPSALFFDRETMEVMGVSGQAIAEFVNDYTIKENSPDGELPAPFSGRGREHVFSAAFLSSQVRATTTCGSEAGGGSS